MLLSAEQRGEPFVALTPTQRRLRPRRLSGTFDQFFHHGMNGKHSIMAFEVLGKNLLSMIKQYDYEGIPIPIVREITR